MVRLLRLLAAALAFMALAPAAAPAADLPAWSPAAGPNLAGYTLAFSDEFNDASGIGNGRGNIAPATPWWNFRHPVLLAGETYVSATDARAYGVAAGVLTMSTYVNAQGVNTEADIETVKAWTNFYAEVRMKGPQVNGVHDGVWFLSVDNGHTDATGGHTELDLVEQYGPSDQGDHSASHLWAGSRPKPVVSESVSAWTVRPEGKAIGWHVYGLEATDDAFTIWRDGAPIQRIARLPSQRVPLYLLLSIFGNQKNAPPATMQVDYVRVYTPGG